MKKFALITEGITDYFVIKNLLLNFFKDDEPIINQIQPAKDETDRQTSGGGWNEVINYCESEDITDIIAYHDYVVVQIDTDIAEEKRINIHINNKEPVELYEAMKNKLLEFISKYTENNENNFIFAIGIHQIECWLVGIIDNKHTNTKITNCLKRLNSAIGKTKKFKIISENKKGDAKETYIKLVSIFRKKKDIIKYSKKNIGFEKFIEQLLSIDNN